MRISSLAVSPPAAAMPSPLIPNQCCSQPVLTLPAFPAPRPRQPTLPSSSRSITRSSIVRNATLTILQSSRLTFCSRPTLSQPHSVCHTQFCRRADSHSAVGPLNQAQFCSRSSQPDSILQSSRLTFCRPPPAIPHRCKQIQQQSTQTTSQHVRGRPFSHRCC